MLPKKSHEPEVEGSSVLCRIALQRKYLYLKRIFKLRHMDFEFALWQMFYLCLSPKKVYRNFHYHQETKRQWARDDPAFLVLLSGMLLVSSGLFAMAMKLSLLEFVKFLLWVVFVDCIGVGLLIGCILALFANRYLRYPCTKDNKEFVEIGYAFDVHLNAFFPLLLWLHVVQLLYMLFPDPMSLPARFFGNSVWLVALVYYLYITFLGYSALPFLRGTVVLLYPVAVCGVIYVISLIFPWSFSKGLIDFYEHRASRFI